MNQFAFDLLILGFTAAVCFLAYLKKSLTAGGALLALIIAAVLYIAGGVFFLAVLLSFFLSSTLISRFKEKEKEKLEKRLHTKTSTRDIVQVAANGGAALICAMVYLWLREDTVVIAFCAALAACNADTWASEIGVLSKMKPVSITTFRPVQKGMSGGVTVLGFLSSATGGVFIAGVYAVFGLFRLPLAALFWNCVVISMAAVFGAVVDSFLGDVVQAKYKTDAGLLTEKPISDSEKNTLVKGFRFVTNDAVNFISSVVAAAFAYGVIGLIY